MLIFFIGLNCLAKNKEKLFLSLKLTKGKGFSDEIIRSLLKKEYYIPTGPLELKEQLQYIIIFHSLFNRIERVIKEMRKVFDTVLKQERLIDLHFNEDPLVGARIIVVFDNQQNLLLGECESTKSLLNYLSYFLQMILYYRLKVGSFIAHCLRF